MAPSLQGCDLPVEGPPCSLSAQCLTLWGSCSPWLQLFKTVKAILITRDNGKKV